MPEPSGDVSGASLTWDTLVGAAKAAVKEAAKLVVDVAGAVLDTARNTGEKGDVTGQMNPAQASDTKAAQDTEIDNLNDAADSVYAPSNEDQAGAMLFTEMAITTATVAATVVGVAGGVQKAVTTVRRAERVKKSAGFTKKVIPRKKPGADGASSRHIVESQGGKTNSVTHQVTKDGKVIHQHQTHIGKYGSKRKFPDDWVEYPKIDEKPK